MKKLKTDSILVGVLSLMTSITSLTAPVVLAEERTSVDLENSQQLKNQIKNDILSTIVNEEIEDPEEAFGKLIQDSEENANESEFGQDNTDIESSDSEQVTIEESSQVDFEADEKADVTLIAYGSFSRGEWRLYSDGFLEIKGEANPEIYTLWNEYAPQIKSIKYVDYSFKTLSGNFFSLFHNYENLESVDFGPYDLTNVTSFCSAFRGLKSLKNVSFKDVTYSSNATLLNMSNMFYGCNSLTELDLSGFDTRSVTNMSNMFYGCSSLLELDLSGFDTSSVTDMNYIMYGCGNLEVLYLNKNFKFIDISARLLSSIGPSAAWQENNNKNLYFSSIEMMSGHNKSNESNIYRKVKTVKLEMDAVGGGFFLTGTTSSYKQKR